MRHRKTIIPMCEPTDEGYLVNDEISSSKKKKSIHQLPTSLSLIAVVVLLFLYIGTYFLSKRMPTPFTIEDEISYPNAFIAERAQRFLSELTKHGPRVVGSEQNEKFAIELINKELQDIKEKAHPSHQILIDNQVITGSYFLHFSPHGFINSYGNVQNVIVKIQGKNDAESLLINSHFDSVPTSPGASDDGIMVAVMMEVIRKLTQKEQAFERSLIFLFNGAEEAPLQAAHGFITQHEWAKSCKLLINLDSAGHGGKAMLFQTGPRGSASLVQHYSNVPFPHAQAAGEEIFQSNLIPSDTDFRIFRDFGGLSGLDIAFPENGYRYHTHFDSFGELPIASYQYAGDMLMTLVKSIGSAPLGLDSSLEKVVYFDVFNLFFISYSSTIATIINVIVSLLSFGVAAISLQRLQISATWSNIFYIAIVTVTILTSWILSGALAMLIAYILDVANKTMTWYRFPLLIVPLYIAPMLACSIGVLNLFHRFGPHGVKNINVQSQIQMHVIRGIWTLVLIVGTILKIRSMYAIMIPVLCNTLGCAIIWALKLQQSARKWTICTFVFSSLGAVFTFYNILAIYTIFIPVTGRMGADRNPELLISLISLFIVLLVLMSYISKCVLIEKPYVLPATLFGCFLFAIIAIFSCAVWPYSGNKITPTPQRIMLFHTNRIHHKTSENLIEKSGIFMLNLDRNSPRTLKDAIQFEEEDISIDCDEYPACAMPISSARMLPIVRFSSWIPFDKAVIKEATSMNYSIETLSNTSKRYHFIVEGPDHITALIRPRNGTAIVSTSVENAQISEILFINHVYGSVKTALTFWIEIESTLSEGPYLDFAVSGKYFNFDKEKMIASFESFIKRIPDWADVIPALATYESYII